MMRQGRFQTLLDARGPEIDLWPEADRAAAQALLAGSEAARDALAEARALDRALSPQDDPASPSLRSVILDIPEHHGRAIPHAPGHPGFGGRSLPRRPVVAGCTAIAASAMIGFAVGLWWPAESTTWQSEDLVALVYGNPDLGARDIDEVLR